MESGRAFEEPVEAETPAVAAEEDEEAEPEPYFEPVQEAEEPPEPVRRAVSEPDSQTRGRSGRARGGRTEDETYEKQPRGGRGFGGGRVRGGRARGDGWGVLRGEANAPENPDDSKAEEF